MFIMVDDALRLLWRGRCTVSIYEDAFDEATARTVQKPKPVYEDVPCRLSHQTKNALGGGAAHSVSQEIRLFLAPEISVPPGCQITVTQNSVTERYKQSGVAAVYEAHQEIPVVLERKWA